MKVYVSEDSLQKTIEYFKNSGISSGEQLGLFFFFKSLGFNDKEFHAFNKVGNIDEESRKEFLKLLYNLSGIFNNKKEDGQEKCCLFPFSIKNCIGKKELFNPGTAFKGLLSRVRDTVDNTLIDKFLRKDDVDSNLFKLPRDYIDVLKSNYLNNNKISLTIFASWYFRFRGIDVPIDWVETPSEEIYKAFTRICVKKLIKEINITETELAELFVYDEEQYSTFSTSIVDGSVFRDMMNYESKYEPVIKNLPSNGNTYLNFTEDIDMTTAVELALPTGRNLTEKSLMQILNASKQVILYGVPGTSKSHIINAVKNNFTYSKLVQFHASMTYEQFIGGTTIDENGNFVNLPGVFLKFCEKAKARLDHSDEKYLFIIDEINRGNVSKIFGETILTLDREYTADLVTSVNCEGKQISTFAIPKNVYIIATMNSADRSIAQIDYAIRRRFAFIKFYPNYELLASISVTSELPNIKPEILFKSINTKIYSVLKDENLTLGHAYFIPKWAVDPITKKIKWSVDDLKMMFNYYIIPIIEEYTYGNSRFLANILGTELPKRIDDNNQFIQELKNQFKVE